MISVCVCVCVCVQDMGTVVLGKVESGGVMKGASLLMMPNRVSIHIHSIIQYNNYSNVVGFTRSQE